MAEGIPRHKAHGSGGLADYYQGDLTRIRALLDDADRDPDPCSMLVLSMGPAGEHLAADGAIVVLKGGDTVELFRQWALRNRILTPGRDFRGGRRA